MLFACKRTFSTFFLAYFRPKLSFFEHYNQGAYERIAFFQGSMVVGGSLSDPLPIDPHNKDLTITISPVAGEANISPWAPECHLRYDRGVAVWPFQEESPSRAPDFDELGRMDSQKWLSLFTL
jgi:hypothetical protein